MEGETPMKDEAKEITPQELAGIIHRHPRVVALTGAGISVESGIPDFRSPGGKEWPAAPWGAVWPAWLRLFCC